MLKSTHKPAPAPGALPPGWTEHRAPTGHTYYYNAETKVSTYTRPGTELDQPSNTNNAPNSYSNAPSLADPKVANAYLAQFNRGPQSHRGGHGGQGRGGSEQRPKPQPIDKPRRKQKIPGHEPWILVYTKYSRRFVYNSAKNSSYWRIPEKLMPAILEMDKARIRAKANGEDPDAEQDEDDSEYEEVEVTDDEGEAQDDDEHPSKRQRLSENDPLEHEEQYEVEGEEDEEGGPVEFTEADIAAQLQAMGEDYGLDPGDYDDGNQEDWPEGTEGVEFSQEDAKLLFKDLLNDFNINPYSPWEKLMEEGKIIEDARYTALNTTKARRECWDEWTREKIAERKAQRAREEKKDPKVSYMAFLQEKATPKLYWPEFKRKYKREEAMKDMKYSEKEREKAYREYISRLKLPQSTLKADLTTLLKAQPPHLLHNRSLADGLPSQVLGDIRYASVEAKLRDPLIEAYVQNLAAPLDDVNAAEDAEEKRKTQEARDKREKALQEHNRMADEQKRRRDREVAASRARLQEEEREIEMAMRVGKRGLQGQLADMKKDEAPAE
ncbi:hypothetical protein Golomagni_05215 [Golovinomyces magnicellulatus]|nr:hypothetical protein Golomagni_05215 [Golovinomyces magnicellulatus]